MIFKKQILVLLSLYSLGNHALTMEQNRFIKQNQGNKELDRQLIKHCASKNPNKETIGDLIARGANPNAKDEWGCTPLYYLCNNYIKPYVVDFELIKFLREKGGTRFNNYSY